MPHEIGEPIGKAVGELEFEHGLLTEGKHGTAHGRGKFRKAPRLAAHLAVHGHAHRIAHRADPRFALVGDVHHRPGMQALHEIDETLERGKPHHLAALQRFVYLMQRLHARPMMHIAYEREAWVSPVSNAVRVTMDRQVRGQPRRFAEFATAMSSPVFPFGQQTVLELKFTDRFPDWFADLVRPLNLPQGGAPKYCGSIILTGEQRVVDGRSVPSQQKLAHVIKYC